MKTFVLLVFVLALCAATPARAQTIDDGIMLTAHSLQAGGIYTRDLWDQYWEGTLKRVNGNIGTITTQATTWTAAYGLTNRLTVFGSVPYVWTHPSQGVLQGQKGWQDLTVAGKYSAVERSPGGHGLLRVIAALSATLPLTDYSPDFAPLSIGSQSRSLSPRATVNYQTGPGIYVTASAAYTVRRTVSLDRPYYFTDGQLFFTNEVVMPDVSSYAITAGYLKGDLNTNFVVSRQRTQGGGDIRRQDMPFLSNRVDFTRLGGMAMHQIPKLRAIAFYVSAAHTLDGRNVGQSNTFAAGVLYSHAAGRSLIR